MKGKKEKFTDEEIQRQIGCCKIDFTLTAIAKMMFNEMIEKRKKKKLPKDLK